MNISFYLIVFNLQNYIIWIKAIADFIKNSPKTRVIQFISSTFEDTKFEQDYLLSEIFPFLTEFCRLLHLEFNIVSMRWGVRSKAGNDHKTSELCMSELYDCINHSVGLAYVTLQSHRYGYRPFPSVILADEFEYIKNNNILTNYSNEYLEPPYWLLDNNSVPAVYNLQPVSSIPLCSNYVLSDDDKHKGKTDSKFKGK